jgi:hypothetical protein
MLPTKYHACARQKMAALLRLPRLPSVGKIAFRDTKEAYEIHIFELTKPQMTFKCLASDFSEKSGTVSGGPPQIRSEWRPVRRTSVAFGVETACPIAV